MIESNISIKLIYRRSLEALLSEYKTAIKLILVLSVMPAIVAIYVSEYLNLDPIHHSSNNTIQLYASQTFSTVISVIIETILMGSLSLLMVTDVQRGKSQFVKCSLGVLRSSGPLAALVLIFSLSVIAGTMAFVIPGIFIYLTWSVSIPVLVVEGRGPLEALRRSSQLTEGARWKIFAALVVLLPIGFVLGFVFDFFGDVVVNSGFGTFSGYIVSVIGNTIDDVIWAAVHASLYVELREWKDGPLVDGLRNVFA